MQWGLGESGDCVYFCLGVCPICTHGLRGWSRTKRLLYLLCPRPENISASKQSSIVSVLGQFISFCPRPKNLLPIEVKWCLSLVFSGLARYYSSTVQCLGTVRTVPVPGNVCAKGRIAVCPLLEMDQNNDVCTVPPGTVQMS